VTRAGPTLADALDRGAAALRAAGVRDPEREARQLLAAAAVWPVGRVWRDAARSLTEEAAERFAEALTRRAEGEPLAYVTGTAGFRSLELVVDRHVLIPRPETEGLVERVLAWGRATRGGASWGRALDLATGSGCIALSLAIEGEFEEIVATDRSDESLAVARRNLERLRPRPPVGFRCGDLFGPVVGEVFDAVVSNPPYVSPDEYAALDAGVRRYEPRAALVSSDGGMAHTRAILVGAGAVLRPGGLLAIEVDSRRASQAHADAVAAGWGDVRIERDLYDRDRFLLAERA
jgi:release factor glutamine methyltransferase